MTPDDKRIFTVTKDGKEIELYIKNLSLEEREKAESVKLRKWNQAVKDGAVFAEKLNDILVEQGLWNIEKETQQKEYQEELIESIRKIKKGGIKLSEARDLAIKIRQLRNKLNVLTMDRVNYVDATVEGQAQNAEFNYEVYARTVYNSHRNRKYFDSYEDFLNRRTDLDAYLCSNKCVEIIYGSPDTSIWPENEFLKKYKFVDEELRLVNEDGHLIDTDGKLIDEFGNYVAVIDGKEVAVDEKGNVISEVSPETVPFLSEDGNPIVEEVPAVEEPVSAT